MEEGQPGVYVRVPSTLRVVLRPDWVGAFRRKDRSFWVGVNTPGREVGVVPCPVPGDSLRFDITFFPRVGVGSLGD